MMRWTTKNGEEIPIEALEDSHLTNILRMLERTADTQTMRLLVEGYSAIGFLQGEMAIDSVEGELMNLENHYGDPSYVWPQYDALLEEFVRRKLPFESIEP